MTSFFFPHLEIKIGMLLVHMGNGFSFVPPYVFYIFLVSTEEMAMQIKHEHAFENLGHLILILALFYVADAHVAKSLLLYIFFSYE